MLSTEPIPHLKNAQHQTAIETVKKVLDKWQAPFNYIYVIKNPQSISPVFSTAIGSLLSNRRLRERGNTMYRHIVVRPKKTGVNIKSGMFSEMYEDPELPSNRLAEYRSLGKKHNCRIKVDRDAVFREWNREEEIEGHDPAILITATCYSPTTTIPYADLTQQSVSEAIAKSMQTVNPTMQQFLDLSLKSYSGD